MRDPETVSPCTYSLAASVFTLQYCYFQYVYTLYFESGEFYIKKVQINFLLTFNYTNIFLCREEVMLISLHRHFIIILRIVLKHLQIVAAQIHNIFNSISFQQWAKLILPREVLTMKRRIVCIEDKFQGTWNFLWAV